MQHMQTKHSRSATEMSHDVPHSPFAEEEHSPDVVNECSGHRGHAAEEETLKGTYAAVEPHPPEQPSVQDNRRTQAPSCAAGTTSNTDAPLPQASTATPTTAGVAARGSPAGRPSYPLPDNVVFRKDPDKDDFGYKATLEAITNPQTVNMFRGGFRTAAFVAFPLFTIAMHPNTMYRLGYPQIMIASVISTSTHQTTLGMQIGVHSWLWRGIVYMLVLGTIMDCWSVHAHIGAWYGMLTLGIFLAGLVSHGMMRRFLYLYFFVYIIEMKMLRVYFGTVPINAAAWNAADFFLGSVWGMAALCFPYPILVKSLLDMIMGKIFEGFGKMFMAMITFVWMPDPHAACLFFNDRSPFMKIEAILEMMSPLLWFANWEPTEFPLHNPIRRLKLSLLRRVMALTYAAFGAGHTIALNRRQQSEQLAMHKIRVTLLKATQGRHIRRLTSPPTPQRAESSFCLPSTTDMLDDIAEEVDQKPPADPIETLRANSESCTKAFGVVLMQCVMLLGTVANTPGEIVKKVPFATLLEKQTQMRRALRLESLQMMKMQADIVSRRVAERQRQEQQQHREEAEARQDVGSDDEEVRVEDDNSPFGRTHRYTISREDAAHILENKEVMDQAQINLRLGELFFHTLMAMIAGEIISFGEQMKEYKPPMSLGLRLLYFFIIEPWNDFWEDLWGILTLARPSDRRKLKDAIRMTCAYLSATALDLELYFLPGGEYFFGPTLLLGFPVEEESLGMAINRMAGNALGCALGFMAYHNAHTLAQQIAMVLCFVFILRSIKDHPVYGQMFLYSAAMTMASLVTSPRTLQLMTRLITCNYTVVAYMLCCMFIFPNNNIKICWGYRCKLSKLISEIVDDVALTVRVRPECHNALAIANNEDTNEPVAYPSRNTEAMQMCSQLNVQMALASRLLAMCDKWAPFAERQHVIRGSSPFPTAASTLVQFTHKRMVAHLRMLVFGVQLLHRPRAESLSAASARLLSGSIGDFLSEFAGCMRLVSQDFIDSLQASRKWSYPLTLSHTSQLSWLRVRLFAIHTECYALASRHLSKSVFFMKPEDYHTLRQEAVVRANSELGQPHEHPIQVDDGAGQEAYSEEGGDPLTVQPNMSFADRFLTARRLGESFAEGNADTDAMERLHDSMYLPQRRASSMLGPGGVPQKSFAHRAPLQESAVQPNDAFPFTQESAEREMQLRLREEAAAAKDQKKKKRSAEGRNGNDGEGDAQPTAAVADAAGHLDGASPSVAFEPVKPRKTKSNVSRLILLQEEDPTLEVPLFRGPDFTYIEDELATEKDTDFSAVTTILCSCYGLIAELEGMTGPMNTVSTYQKELHESSLAIGLIDKLSEKVLAFRNANYERYHFPTPAEGQRGPLHTQSDPFGDWRF